MGQFRARDLNACKVPMVTHTDLAEPEPVEGLFRPFNLAEILTGYWTSVLDTRRKASTRGFVPNSEPGFSSKMADLRLRELRRHQGSHRMMLTGCLLTGPKLTPVVKIHAVGDLREPARVARLLHPGEKLVFAMK